MEKKRVDEFFPNSPAEQRFLAQHKYAGVITVSPRVFVWQTAQESPVTELEIFYNPQLRSELPLELRRYALLARHCPDTA